MNEQEIIDAFTKVADRVFGKAPQSEKYPQHVRFESYFKMFKEGIEIGKQHEAQKQ